MLLVDFKNAFNLVDRCFLLKKLGCDALPFPLGLSFVMRVQPGFIMRTPSFGHVRVSNKVILWALCCRPSFAPFDSCY